MPARGHRHHAVRIHSDTGCASASDHRNPVKVSNGYLTTAHAHAQVFNLHMSSVQPRALAPVNSHTRRHWTKFHASPENLMPKTGTAPGPKNDAKSAAAAPS